MKTSYDLLRIPDIAEKTIHIIICQQLLESYHKGQLEAFEIYNTIASK